VSPIEMAMERVQIQKPKKHLQILFLKPVEVHFPKIDYFQLVLDNSNINLEVSLIKTSVKHIRSSLIKKIKSI